MAIKSGYTFPILDSSGNPTSTVADMADMFVRKELFLDAGLWAWGNDAYGKLGLGTTAHYSSPVQVGSLTNWKYLSQGDGTFGIRLIKTDGTLWACGYNFSGELGNGTTTDYSSPIQIGSLTDWKQVSMGGYWVSHTTAVKTDGTLWAWGDNNRGQLGNGTLTSYSSPIQIGSLTNWKQVACGYKMTAAIKTDGTLWAWGWNQFGQLANGTTTNYSSPIQIGSSTNWKQVACGYSFSIAIKTDGTLWGWGYNNSGNLGNGTNQNRYSSPIQIGSLTNWKQVSCGYGSTAAIKTDGTLWVWGGTSNGGLYSSPIQVGALTTWKQVSENRYMTAVVKTDGTLWAWGSNFNGSLGIGNTTSYTSPVQVGALTTWKQVACGYRCAYAIQSPDLP